MKTLLAGLALASLTCAGGLVAPHPAAASAPITVRVTERDFAIALSRTRLPAGRQIRLVVTNRGPSTHELVLEPAAAVDKALRYRGTTYEADGIRPGTTRTVIWTIPRSGTFKFACHIGHHFQLGMRTLVRAT